MMKNAYKTFDEIEPDHRQFYIERGGLVVIQDGLDDLVQKYNELETTHGAAMAERDKRIADATAERAALQRKRALRHALQLAGVPAKWHAAASAVIQVQDGVPLETTVRRFLDSPDGEPYRGRQESPLHFTAKLHRMN